MPCSPVQSLHDDRPILVIVWSFRGRVNGARFRPRVQADSCIAISNLVYFVLLDCHCLIRPLELSELCLYLVPLSFVVLVLEIDQL